MCLLVHIVVGPPPFSPENTALVLDAGAKHNTTKQHLVTALACYQTLLSDNSDGAVDDGTGLLSNLTLRQQWKSSWWQRWLVVKSYSQTTMKEQLVTALACCEALLSDNNERAVGDSTGLLWSLALKQYLQSSWWQHWFVVKPYSQTTVKEQLVTALACCEASFQTTMKEQLKRATGTLCGIIFRHQWQSSW